MFHKETRMIFLKFKSGHMNSFAPNALIESVVVETVPQNSFKLFTSRDGGLCPLPLKLGGSVTDSSSRVQQKQCWGPLLLGHKNNTASASSSGTLKAGGLNCFLRSTTTPRPPGCEEAKLQRQVTCGHFRRQSYL